jgi:preprotein translocase subunit SecG
MNFIYLLASNIAFASPTHELVHGILTTVMLILMFVAALTAVVLVLLQPANSSGIDALGGSSETFFGKNKGKSIEAKMKKWTWICLAVLLVLSVCFYILQLPVIWS